MVPFRQNIVVIGCGSVAQCTLPILFNLIDIPPSSVTVIDFVDNRFAIEPFIKRGVRYEQLRLTQENYREVLAKFLSQGDLLVDLAWNLETASLIEWCQQCQVRYINTSVELWSPFDHYSAKDPRELTLYHRQMELKDRLAALEKKGPTAIVDHGANPGLVSHFVKQGLMDIAQELLKRPLAAERQALLEQALHHADFPRLAQAIGLKTIHISERDTQIASDPKRVNEFVNTWSIEGIIEEGMAPSEIGWGTHEKQLPPGALLHAKGPGNQICLSQKGIHTWVRSWVPSGPIVGMAIRHGEAFSLSQFLTVYQNGQAVYRPTVHYAYCPCDSTINSLHELCMRAYRPQEERRILSEEILSGSDELGCLLMGHDLKAWWIGSVLDIEEARRLVPGQNATTVQVAIGVIAAIIYAIRHPQEGFCLPDDLNYQEIMEVAKPYLGRFLSHQVDWSPLSDAKAFLPFNGSLPKEEEEWQFASFRV